MKKLMTSLAAVSLLALALTGCAVSDAETADCEASGGSVTSETFRFKGEDSDFFKTSTGSLYYCSVNGQITKVYNDEVLEVSSGFFGYSGDNQKVFNDCKALEGRVYKTSFTSGKTTFTYLACVHGGAYVKLL